MNDTCPECGDVMHMLASRCACGWVRPVPTPVKSAPPPTFTATATTHVDPAAVAKLKAHMRHGLGQGAQRRTILRPDESYPDFLQALHASGKTRAAFESERLAAHGWSAEDEQAFQDRLRDLQLSYRYQRTGGHKA